MLPKNHIQLEPQMKNMKIRYSKETNDTYKVQYLLGAQTMQNETYLLMVLTHYQ